MEYFLCLWSRESRAKIERMGHMRFDLEPLVSSSVPFEIDSSLTSCSVSSGRTCPVSSTNCRSANCASLAKFPRAEPWAHCIGDEIKEFIELAQLLYQGALKFRLPRQELLPPLFQYIAQLAFALFMFPSFAHEREALFDQLELAGIELFCLD